MTNGEGIKGNENKLRREQLNERSNGQLVYIFKNICYIHYPDLLRILHDYRINMILHSEGILGKVLEI